MNDWTERRKRIKRRDRLRLLGYLAAAAAVVTLVLLLTGNGKRKAEAAAMAAAAAATPSPVFEDAAPDPKSLLPQVDLTSWEMKLANGDHPLGEDFAPPQLTQIERGESFDSRAAEQLTLLMDAARGCGYTVYLCSGYRDYETQSSIYWNHVWTYVTDGMTQAEAEAKTKLSVNYPGCSEHQLGLAADILEYQNQEMESYIGGSGLMLWLEENCCRFGFTVRYPQGKEGITGVEYEPWHLRYVGEAAATYMMANGLCLEEFLALYE